MSTAANKAIRDAIEDCEMNLNKHRGDVSFEPQEQEELVQQWETLDREMRTLLQPSGQTRHQA